MDAPPASACGGPTALFAVAWSPMVVPSLVCVVREGRWSRDFLIFYIFPGRPPRRERDRNYPRVDKMIVVWQYQWARYGRVCVTRETIE